MIISKFQMCKIGFIPFYFSLLIVFYNQVWNILTRRRTTKGFISFSSRSVNNSKELPWSNAISYVNE